MAVNDPSNHPEKVYIAVNKLTFNFGYICFMKPSKNILNHMLKSYQFMTDINYTKNHKEGNEDISIQYNIGY